MTRSRARAARLTPAVLTAFLAGGVVPRAVLLVHRHPGAALPHVHAEDAFSPRASVPIHRQPARPRGDRAPGVRAAGEDGWHAHPTDPFQQAVEARLVRALRAETRVVVDVSPSIAPRVRPLAFAAARSPPSALV